MIKVYSLSFLLCEYYKIKDVLLCFVWFSSLLMVIYLKSNQINYYEESFNICICVFVDNF